MYIRESIAILLIINYYNSNLHKNVSGLCLLTKIVQYGLLNTNVWNISILLIIQYSFFIVKADVYHVIKLNITVSAGHDHVCDVFITYLWFTRIAVCPGIF